MTEFEKRQHRCAFTGHRPEKLHISEITVRDMLLQSIEDAYADGYNVFISGMARGVDLWAADIVLKLKEKFPDIKLICAVPFNGHDSRWSTFDSDECQRIIKAADLIRYICGSYFDGCFQVRNEWMIDHCSRLISVWDGTPSGTGNAVRYAAKQGITIVNLQKTE